MTVPIAIPAKTTLGPVQRVGPTNYEYYGIVLETDEEFADWGMPYQDVHDEDEQ